MHEPDIAPLARRLAEENNVDWRRLPGSGDGGRVVERDVLGYLARVMAGDEAVDPTPEPVPDGMVAWPEDDVISYRARQDEPPAPSPPTLDDELFLFDDPLPEPTDAQPDPLDDDAPAPWPAHPSATFADAAPASDDDAVLLMGDDVADDPAAVEARGDDGPIDAIRFDAYPDLPEPDAEEPEAAWEGAPAADARAHVELPDLFASGDDGEAHDAARAGPELLFEDVEAAGDVSAVEATGANGEPTFEAPERFDDAGTEPSVDADPGSEDDDDPLADATDLDALDRDGDDVAPAPASAPPAAWGVDGPAAIAATGPSIAAPEPNGAHGFAFVRHGQVWRRRLDDRPLRKAASEVAAELDVSPSAVTAVLLARAALRTGAVTGPVDALRWRGGVPGRGAAAGEGDLRTAIRAVEGAAAGGGGAAALVVADLSDLDLDEAVLHLEAPVLTLGRAAGGDTWLCLAGDDVDGALVDALAAIAALLSTPVRLLV